MKYLEFWNPDSGAIGGFIFGIVITIVIFFIRKAASWFDRF
jgi:high-affinity Fe2+/Pb2+ permease